MKCLNMKEFGSMVSGKNYTIIFKTIDNVDVCPQFCDGVLTFNQVDVDSESMLITLRNDTCEMNISPVVKIEVDADSNSSDQLNITITAAELLGGTMELGEEFHIVYYEV